MLLLTRAHPSSLRTIVMAVVATAVGTSVAAIQLRGARFAWVPPASPDPAARATDGAGVSLSSWWPDVTDSKGDGWLVAYLGGCRSCQVGEDAVDALLRSKPRVLVVVPAGIARPIAPPANQRWVEDADGRIATALRVRAMPRFYRTDARGVVLRSVTPAELGVEGVR